MHTLLLKHRTQPGRRDEVEAVWLKHMAPAIQTNPGHIMYAYSFGLKPDEIVAFQVYRDAKAAEAFLQNPDYLAYLEASRSLLVHEPEVLLLDTRWIKQA